MVEKLELVSDYFPWTVCRRQRNNVPGGFKGVDASGGLLDIVCTLGNSVSGGIRGSISGGIGVVLDLGIGSLVGVGCVSPYSGTVANFEVNVLFWKKMTVAPIPVFHHCSQVMGGKRREGVIIILRDHRWP